MNRRTERNEIDLAAQRVDEKRSRERAQEGEGGGDLIYATCVRDN